MTKHTLGLIIIPKKSPYIASRNVLFRKCLFIKQCQKVLPDMAHSFPPKIVKNYLVGMNDQCERNFQKDDHFPFLFFARMFLFLTETRILRWNHFSKQCYGFLEVYLGPRVAANYPSLRGMVCSHERSQIDQEKTITLRG